MDADLVRLVCLGLANDEQMEKLGVENVVAIKAGEPQYRQADAGLLLPSLEKKDADGKPGLVEHLMTSEVKDRAGDKVSRAGADFKDFRRNPVLLWSHMRWVPPIGAVRTIKKGTDAQGNKGWVSGSEFASEVSDHAKLIEGLVRGKWLRAVSIGFMPTDIVRPKDAADADKLGISKFGVLFRKWSLHELSPCSVPCNQNAVQQALSTWRDDGTYPKALINDFEKSLPKGDGGPQIEYIDRSVFDMGAVFAKAVVIEGDDDGAGKTRTVEEILEGTGSDDVAESALGETLLGMSNKFADAFKAVGDQVLEALKAQQESIEGLAEQLDASNVLHDVDGDGGSHGVTPKSAADEDVLAAVSSGLGDSFRDVSVLLDGVKSGASNNQPDADKEN